MAEAMTDVKEWLKDNPIDTEADAKAFAERYSEKGEALRKEWEGKEPETKEEAMAILKPFMKDVMRDLTKTMTSMVVKQAVKTVIEQHNAEQN